VPAGQVRVAEVAEDVAVVPLVRVGVADPLEARGVARLRRGNGGGSAGQDERPGEGGGVQQAQKVPQGEE